MNLRIDTKAEYILNKLKENGFEGFIVGGCVRDLILGKTPKDYDITTNAKPEKIIETFKDHKTILTGIKYGTVTVLIDKIPFEITTYRKEQEYINNRKPKGVIFLSSIEEDLYRRDFTINSMAYNNDKKLIDLYGGVNDIQKGIIRAIGNKDKKFEEDAIRILRAYRFAGRYDWKIEEETKNAMLKNMNLLNNIAKERIIPELKEIFESGMDINKMEFITTLFPVIKDCFNTYQNNKYHMRSVGEHIYNTFNNIDNVFHLKMTMLLHDIGKVYTKTTDQNNVDHFYNHADISREKSKIILNEFKFDNNTKHKILTLIENHDKYMAPEPKYIKKMLNKIGEDLFFDLIKVRIADDSAKNQELVKNNIKIFNETLTLTKKIIKEKQPYSIKDLDISGKDLMELGYEGKEIGEILNFMLDKVIENESLNNKIELLSLLNKIKK
ncbi:CCA tRNA nucleotidyltransferase [Anaerofustis sp. HA2171]|uniref:CCA tRNA nucleotidyltransferase n=1 Tax=Anaerofustis butyriciformans TaxID=3108533 RepID=UPI002E352EE5|nr:HD domain-containing protein [Anaerofustis sp. HA2171]